MDVRRLPLARLSSLGTLLYVDYILEAASSHTYRTCLLGSGHGTSERASVHGTRAAPRAPERKQAGWAG